MNLFFSLPCDLIKWIGFFVFEPSDFFSFCLSCKYIKENLLEENFFNHKKLNHFPITCYNKNEKNQIEIFYFSPLYEKKHGKYKSFFINNKIYIECNYKYGLLDGFYYRWWENGNLHKKYKYKNGKKNGSYEEWHMNGKKSIEFFFINDKRNGLFQEWWRNGRIHLKCFYRDDHLEGTFERWYISGKKHQKEYYKKGEKIRFVYWDQNEKLQKKGAYVNGNLVDIQYFR